MLRPLQNRGAQNLKDHKIRRSRSAARRMTEKRGCMLYNLLVPLADQSIAFNVFRYITFRSGGAVFTSLILCFFIGPSVIRWLKARQREGQPIRDDGPESHRETKKGTPTMGGVMILLSLGISTLLWTDLTN